MTMKLNALFPAKSAGFLSLPGVLLAAAAVLLLATPSQAFSRPGDFGAESYNAPLPHSSFSGTGPMGSFSQRRNLESLSVRAYEIEEIVVKGKRFDWEVSERLRAQDEIRQWAQRQAFVARACFDARSTRRPAIDLEVASGAYLRPSASRSEGHSEQSLEQGGVEAGDPIAELATELKALTIAGVSALAAGAISKSPSVGAYAGVGAYTVGRVADRTLGADYFYGVVHEVAKDGEKRIANPMYVPPGLSGTSPMPVKAIADVSRRLLGIEQDESDDQQGQSEIGNFRSRRGQGTARSCR